MPCTRTMHPGSAAAPDFLPALGRTGTYAIAGDWILQEETMKLTAAVLVGVIAGSFSCAFAQSGSSGQSGSAGTGASGTGGGSTLSSGNTISGTGGSPGPNTSNAMKRGTTGNNLGAPQTSSGSDLSSGNAVNTPAATGAAQSLGNTDTGILKK
jgi:hypothetical protein